MIKEGDFVYIIKSGKCEIVPMKIRSIVGDILEIENDAGWLITTKLDVGFSYKTARKALVRLFFKQLRQIDKQMESIPINYNTSKTL